MDDGLKSKEQLGERSGDRLGIVYGLRHRETTSETSGLRGSRESYGRCEEWFGRSYRTSCEGRLILPLDEGDYSEANAEKQRVLGFTIHAFSLKTNE